MTAYADLIKNFKPIDIEKYSAVSSREKLVVYTMGYLKEQDIPLTFNSICIATYKLFPEKFYFSEEFKEFPHIEMLNRTILHLRPIERNYAAGSVRMGYELTPLGEEIARQVKTQIESGFSSKHVPQVMDPHKKTSENDLNKILNSDIFKEWLSTSEVDELKLWDFFGVTPYTQSDKIKSFLRETEEHAKSKDEQKVIQFINFIRSQIL